MFNICSFLPKKTCQLINRWIFELNVDIKLSKPRKTKFGDFKVINNKLYISINNNLNRYSFLITLVHELAHAFVYRKHQNNVKPHGNEWKKTFKLMMLNFLTPNHLPNDILNCLSKHLINPAYSSFSDIELAKVLRNYNNKKTLILDEIEERSIFKTLENESKSYIKGKKRRKYYECIEEKSYTKYLFHTLTEVTFAKKQSV